MGEEQQTISLVDEEGNEHEFQIVDVIEVQEHRYAILQPSEGGDHAVIFRVEDDDTLSTVDDEEEIERVTAALEDLGEYGAVEVDEDDDEEEEEEEENDDEEEDEDLDLDDLDEEDEDEGDDEDRELDEDADEDLEDLEEEEEE